MRPKPLEWQDDDRSDSSGDLVAYVWSRLGNFEVTVHRGETKWVLWISRMHGGARIILVCNHFATRVKAKATGEIFWQSMVVDLLEGEQ